MSESDTGSLIDATADTVADNTDETTNENDNQYDWVLDKYKAEDRSIEDSALEQGKAYNELSKKFGAFTGAPDEETGYEVTLPEGVEGEFYEDNPMLDEFKQIAMEGGMSQDMFTKVLHSYIGNDVSMSSTSVEGELSQLGENAQKRLSGIADWGKANLSEEQYGDILSITSTAAGVRAVEALIGKTRTPQIPVNDMETRPSNMPSHSELRERMADPRYQSDAAFRAETSKMYSAVFGDEPLKQVM